MKLCLAQKKRAFLQGDKQKVRELEREFRRQTDPASFAEELNTFFSRFNQNKASDSFSCQTLTNNQAPAVDEQLVTSILHRVNPHRASGADRLRGSKAALHRWVQSSPDCFSIFWTLVVFPASGQSPQ